MDDQTNRPQDPDETIDESQQQPSEAPVFVETPNPIGEDEAVPLTPEDLDHLSDDDELVASAELVREIEQAQAPEEGKKKKSLGREILEWVLVIVVAVAAALLIRTFIFEPVRVDGRSMENTLHDGEYMIVTKYQYLFGDPERFDVVICHYPNRGNTNFVKRVVGLPGDTVAMQGGTLYVNGEAIEEDYIDHHADYTMYDFVVPEGYYFVLGDNRSNSNDSHTVGPLERSNIVGKVRLVVWPFSEFRTIK